MCKYPPKSLEAAALPWIFCSRDLKRKVVIKNAMQHLFPPVLQKCIKVLGINPRGYVDVDRNIRVSLKV